MFTPPVWDQRFVLETIAGLGDLARLPGFTAATPDVVGAVLDEAAKLATQVFLPLDRVGDRSAMRAVDGEVHTPQGFQAAWRAYAEGGWIGLAAAPAHGGQGLPFVLASAVHEQITAANLAFSLCPMLTMGAIRALEVHGSAEQQETYLRPLIEGRWTGTMNLTEPQAGSDVGALTTSATPAGDGSWRIRGQKIFITWGEHDLTENIVHLVLARTPGAAAGTRGISLFLVPKFLPDADGRPGERNDLRAVSLEEKLGIHASPTCTMAYGDNGRCTGFLVGEEQGGMRAMFTMMNHARVNVGLEGVAVAERAFQHALSYARERVQGARFGHGHQPVPIIDHLDVRRLLLTGRALADAARAICYRTAAATDRALGDEDSGRRAAAQAEADLLTPVAKAFSTDIGVEVASLSLQVFGGAGYIEETGAAQFYRDARITPIYEGTNGIQALDLVGRKLTAEGGRPLAALLAGERRFLATMAGSALAGCAPALGEAISALERASAALQERLPGQPDDVAAAATPYLRLFGLVLGGALLARQGVAAEERLAAGGDRTFLQGKIATALFYLQQILPQAGALLPVVLAGAGPLATLPADGFSRS